MTTKQQRRLSISLYLNYFVHGLGLIILAQNMQALGKFWQTPIATVSYVISGVGIGRLLAYLLLGYLSDRYGRKAFVYLGMLSYLVFFVGMTLVTNVQVAYLLAILAGIANSALDSGTYTTFVEMGGKQGSSNVLIKAFMSAGEFLLPLFVALTESHGWWYGWSFWLAAAVLLVNFVLIAPLKFPKANQSTNATNALTAQLAKPRRWLATISLAGYGYTSMAMMILYTQWISLFATRQLHMSNVSAHLLLSLYSIGSITGVLVIFWLLRRSVAETNLLVVLNAGALASLLVICLVPVAWLDMIAAFAFGFMAAGGVMQVGLNLFLKLYPHIKGRITGIFFTFGSLASFTIPLITGWLSKQSIGAAMNFDLLIAVISVGLVVVTKLALGKPTSLAAERQQINQLDQQIVHLLAKRFDTVTKIGEIKQQQQTQVLDQSRENQVLERVAKNSPDEDYTPYMQAIYKEIMANSRAYQKQLSSKEQSVSKTNEPLQPTVGKD